MTDPFAGVAEALAAARDAWASSELPVRGVDGMSGAGLMAFQDAVASLRRQVDAVQVQVAAQIARASRPELGGAGLARQQGFRTPVALIAAATGGSSGEAARLVAVGEAVAPRTTLTGESAPARHPAVAEAVRSGRLSVDGAAAIVAMLDRITLRASRDDIDHAEAELVGKAVGLPLDQLHKVLQRAEAWLDPDGVEPREDALRSERSLHFREDHRGMLHLTGKLDPESAAPVRAAIEAIVGTELSRRQEGVRDGLDDDRHPAAQLQVDALAIIYRHALGCESADVPTAGAAVVVRIDLDRLESGIGHGTIDGLAHPISVATVRRMAAGRGVIPCVLGGEGEILDFGRSRRLFSAGQKLALVERDGGCAMCGLPSGMTQVHHIRWWTRDAGPTDLGNGVLLCTR